MQKLEIGSDLVANAVAAYDRFKDFTIAVDFGTALTFTTVDNHGNILGVSIAPGLKTAINSLTDKTAQLPPVPLEMPATLKLTSLPVHKLIAYLPGLNFYQ